MLSCVRYSENIDKLLLRGGGGGANTYFTETKVPLSVLFEIICNKNHSDNFDN